MKLTNFILLLGLVSFLGDEANAQPEFPESPAPGLPPIAQKIPIADGPEGLGLGLAVGDPTGLAIAHRPVQSFTMAGVFGWSLQEAKMHAHCDFLYRVYKAQPSESAVTIDIAAGAGPTLNLGVSNDDDTGLGVRVVGVASINFNDKPFDLYLDVAPVIGLIPETALFFNSTLGFRGWFVPPKSSSYSDPAI